MMTLSGLRKPLTTLRRLTTLRWSCGKINWSWALEARQTNKICNLRMLWESHATSLSKLSSSKSIPASVDRPCQLHLLTEASSNSLITALWKEGQLQRNSTHSFQNPLMKIRSLVILHRGMEVTRTGVIASWATTAKTAATIASQQSTTNMWNRLKSTLRSKIRAAGHLRDRFSRHHQRQEVIKLQPLPLGNMKRWCLSSRWQLRTRLHLAHFTDLSMASIHLDRTSSSKSKSS